MVKCPTCQITLAEGVFACPVDGTPIVQVPGMVGKVLGDRYRVLARLGEGGMGTVYLVEHVMLGKRMAAKVLRDEFSRREEVVQRFQQEAVAAGRIGQENIVNVTDFGWTAEGALYFVMELIEGESLATAVTTSACLPVERALPIFMQICRALIAAHAQGIVHRDLKPDNVMLVRRDDNSELVKILDFGISKVTAQQTGNSRLTQVGAIMGTPDYMAPEQAAGTAVDHRVDVYSFGVLAYESLTGSVPFTADSALGVLLKHQTAPPDPLTRRRPDLFIPPDLEALVMKTLAKRPDERQRSMNEVAQDLWRVWNNLPVEVKNRATTPIYLGRSPTSNPSLPVVQMSQPTTSATSTPYPRGGTVHLSLDEIAPQLDEAIDLARATKPTEPATVIPADELVSKSSRVPRRRSWVLPVVVLFGAVAAAGGWYVASMQGLVPKIGLFAEETSKTEAVPPAPPPQNAVAEAPRPPAPVTPTPPAPPPTVQPASKLGGTKKVSIASDPPGAQVFQGKERLGSTPMEIELDEGSSGEYRFALAGYNAVFRTVSSVEDRVEVKLTPEKRTTKKKPAPAKGDDPFRKGHDLKNPFE